MRLEPNGQNLNFVPTPPFQRTKISLYSCTSCLRANLEISLAYLKNETGKDMMRMRVKIEICFLKIEI